MKKKQVQGNFILRILQGLLVGAVCIIPGASGGVLAVSMGLYEPCVDALYGLLRHFRTEGKRNFLFLFPLGLGGAAGLFACSFALEWLLANFHQAFMFSLMGLVLGGLPGFFKEANAQGFRPSYLIATLVGAGVLGAIAYAGAHVSAGAGLSYNALTAALSGALIVAGTMLPGFSTSFVLMMLGTYEPTLHALTHLQLDMLCFVALGGVLGGALMLLFVRRMFKKHHGYAYYAMLGLLFASLFGIFPGVTPELLVWDILLFAVGFLIGWGMTKIAKVDPLTTVTEP